MSGGDRKLSVSEEKVLQIAEEFIHQVYPEFSEDGATPQVNDEGEKWVVTYQLPVGVIGGVPTVIIDESSLKVLDSYHTQ